MPALRYMLEINLSEAEFAPAIARCTRAPYFIVGVMPCSVLPATTKSRHIVLSAITAVCPCRPRHPSLLLQEQARPPLRLPTRSHPPPPAPVCRRMPPEPLLTSPSFQPLFF